jgi:hypothetical protein
VICVSTNFCFGIRRKSTACGRCRRTSALKGQCQEIFDPRFFHLSIHPRALFQVLKPFRVPYGFEFAEKFEIFVEMVVFCDFNEAAKGIPRFK